MLATLKNPRFARLYLAQLISIVGDGIFMLALTFGVLDATDSLVALGLIFAVSAALQSAASLIAGVWADRLPRVRLMLSSDLVRMVVQLALAYCFFNDVASLLVLLPLVAVYWTATAVFQPALTGFIPQVLPPTDLVAGNGMLVTTRSVAQIVGAALGAALVGFYGPAWATLADAATFAVSAVLLLGLRDVPAAAGSDVRSSLRQELAVGWAEVRARRWIWVAISATFAYLMVYQGPMEILGPYVARDELGGARAWGTIGIALMVGALIGAWVAGSERLRRPMVLAILLFYSLSAAPLLLAVAAPLPVLCGAFCLVGIGYGMFEVIWHASLQEQIPEDRISRVSSWDWMASLAGLPIGFAVAAFGSRVFGVDALLVVMSAGAFIITCVLLASPDVRSLGSRKAITAR